MSGRRSTLPIAGRSRFAALGLLGAASLAIGWYRSAGTVVFRDQMGSGALAAAGSIAVCLAVALRTMAGRRTVERRLADLVERASGLPVSPGPAARAPAADVFVATPSMGRYHRPSCPLAIGKPTQPASRGAHEAAGKERCGVCQP
jgi:hypothetical protein